MKLKYKLLLSVALIATVAAMPCYTYAQAGDTLVVQWETEPGNFTPQPNALRNAILSDTERPEGRVYKLLQGGFYQITDAIESNFHLRIVGEPGDPDDIFANPPAIQMVLREDGAAPSGRIITASSSLTLKNLWITGADNDGTQTYYEPIVINASNSVIDVDNVTFDRSNFSLLAFYGTGNEIYLRNSHFRNMIGRPSTQQWEGRTLSIWADQKKAIVENNTFFNIGFTVFQMEGGSVDYVSFVHNTLVNVGRLINAGNWWNEAYFANNLIINGYWHGEGAADLAGTGRDPRLANSGGGMFTIGNLPFIYGPNEGRRILFTNTASWRDPAFETHYADSIARQPFIGIPTREDYFELYDNMVIGDTTWLANRPSFGNFPEGLVNDMIQNITDLRSGITPANPYFWNRIPIEGGIPCEECVMWPIPEDFSYTDNNLLTASTNDLPLGDLNWFPAAKADWYANRDTYMQEIEDKAGAVVELEVEFTVEAEDGTVSGDAIVDSFDGFAYFQMDGGGWFSWEFEIDEAGQYDLNVWTHMRNNGQRGQRIILNGVHLKDPKGWGEYIWDTNDGVHAGMVINDWTWTLITNENMHPDQSPDGLMLPAGTNTLRIESSWGYQNFAGFDFIPAGGNDPVVELRPPTAQSSIVAEVCGDSDYCPSGFQKVLLGSDGGTGSITWDFNLTQAGRFFLIAFYQAPFGPQTGELTVSGVTEAIQMEFDGVEGDESAMSASSEMFNLGAGSHSMTLSNNGAFNVDFVQLIRFGSATSIPKTETPEGYMLSQNYPNPFNPTTSINYTIPESQDVRITVYNVLGQRVAVLADGFHSAGQHHVSFDARRLASGMYIYRIEAGNFIHSRKMLLVK